MSVLERATLVEASAMREELERRVARITEELRAAAQTEVRRGRVLGKWKTGAE